MVNYKDRELIEQAAQAAWNAVFRYLDAEPGIGGEVSGYIASMAAKATRAAGETMFGTADEDAPCLCGASGPHADCAVQA